MGLLNKEDLLIELEAIKASMTAHQEQMKLHTMMIKREKILKFLVTRELERFK